MEPKKNMLWNVEIGNTKHGSRGQSEANYNVIAPDLIGACGIALTKAISQYGDEFEEAKSWEPIEAKLLNVDVPLE